MLTHCAFSLALECVRPALLASLNSGLSTLADVSAAMDAAVKLTQAQVEVSSLAIQRASLRAALRSKDSRFTDLSLSVSRLLVGSRQDL